MGDELILCMESCRDSNNSGALVGNQSYDLECITQCSQRHTTLYRHTAEKYVSEKKEKNSMMMMIKSTSC